MISSVCLSNEPIEFLDHRLNPLLYDRNNYNVKHSSVMNNPEFDWKNSTTVKERTGL